MIWQVITDLNAAQRVAVRAAPVKLSRPAELADQFRLYLFERLLEVTDRQHRRAILKARRHFVEHRPERSYLRRTYRPMMYGGLGTPWRSLPFHAAHAVLSSHPSALARFMRYTALAMAVHRGCRTSLASAEAALKDDRYLIWAEFSTALARLVAAQAKSVVRR